MNWNHWDSAYLCQARLTSVAIGSGPASVSLIRIATKTQSFVHWPISNLSWKFMQIRR